MARIAVVIPTYNRGSAIDGALDSVLSGDDDVEVIVVDDGSTDNTEAVVRRRTDPRLRFHRLPAKGNGNVARNAGIAQTTAPIVAFLDSDDRFLPGRLGRLAAWFDAHPDLDGVCDGFEVLNHGASEAARQPDRVLTGTDLVEAMVCHAVPLTCSSIAVRRKALDAIGGFDESLPRQQDRDLLLRLAGHRIAFGTGDDVVKVQSRDSISKQIVAYTSGLDGLVGRHPTFATPEHRDVLAYLVSRIILKAATSGHLRAAWLEARALSHAKHMPHGVFSALARYRRGKRIRKRLTRDLLT